MKRAPSLVSRVVPVAFALSLVACRGIIGIYDLSADAGGDGATHDATTSSADTGVDAGEDSGSSSSASSSSSVSSSSSASTASASSSGSSSSSSSSGPPPHPLSDAGATCAGNCSTMPEFMNEIQGFVAAFNAAGCTCQTCLNASNECQMSGGSCNPMAPVDGATPSAKCPMCIAALVADHQCPGVASGCSGANSCTNLLECIMKCADAGP